jgi:hypothetical protein
MTSQTRRHHIATARELARELRDAAARFDEVALGKLAPAELWPAMQLDPTLVARFRAFLEKLWFDGIRSRYFAEFDASKLILPVATDVACRLDKLVIELEMQIAACEENSRCAAAGEMRAEK